MTRTVLLPLGKGGDGLQRRRQPAWRFAMRRGRILADNVMFGSDAQQVGIDFDWEIVNLQIADRPQTPDVHPGIDTVGLIWRFAVAPQRP